MLIVEFTGIGQQFLVPLSLAVAGSISISRLSSADRHMRGPATTPVRERTADQYALVNESL